MTLIVGLGNPGKIYENSRHNIGFAVIKELAKKYKIPLKKENRIIALSGRGNIEGKSVLLALPLTFMNLSGGAVCGLIKKYNIDLESLLVVTDDMDLELGRLRLRQKGSSGGHKGLKSVIDCLGGKGFSRLRIGIGRPREVADPAEYVLSSFRRPEKNKVKESVEMAVCCCLAWLSMGTAAAMNIFNKKE
ncbi:MAG: aminoacyl-tRNA hydrolase [Candidatus Omnitrophota bacterium]